jgi:Na+-transporting methylmalonyl-CoA/oxaloacetate decarboxylase gamma subunit
MNPPFSSEAFKVFSHGLGILGLGMGGVLGLLLVLYLLIKLMIKVFPEKK